MKKFFPIMAIVPLLAVVILAGGCALAKKNAEEAKTKKELLLEKKKKHDQLFKELSDKLIKQGTSASEIRERFGEPDDIFKSGSSTSSLDIWTYDKMLATKDEPQDWDTILLYFESDRLITWKY
jgi:hypothetical protein